MTTGGLGEKLSGYKLRGARVGLAVGYMGTKKFLAPVVRDVISDCPPGAVLDIFSGMGSVAEALAESRPVWMNDIQIFASEVGRALFTSIRGLPSRDVLESQLLAKFEQNARSLERRFHETLAEERTLLAEGTVSALQRANDCVTSRLSTSYATAEIRRLNRMAGSPFRLFTLNYAGRYLSLQQAIQLDSIRFAVDSSKLTRERKRWLLIALGITLLRVATTTGHFAQFLSPKAANANFFGRQRRRDLLATFWQEAMSLGPVGTRQWRSQNKVFRKDAIALLESLASRNQQLAVVYADPPYTDDHYSRFYHLWETLFLYDYPKTTGKAGYRTDRFQTEFAIKSKVEASLERLARAAKQTGAHLVLSYPESGLLSRIPVSVEEVVQRHYKDCRPVHFVRHAHSTMGGSDGRSKRHVTEVVYLATN